MSNQWIAVSPDTMPPVMEYIICWDGNEVHSRLFGRAWESLSLAEFKQKSNITHWQPLPPPPSTPIPIPIQERDEDELWDEVIQRVMTNYHAYNYPKQTVFELKNRYTITKKQ